MPLQRRICVATKKKKSKIKAKIKAKRLWCVVGLPEDFQKKINKTSFEPLSIFTFFNYDPNHFNIKYKDKLSIFFIYFKFTAL